MSKSAKKKPVEREYQACGCGSTTFLRYTEVCDHIKIYADPKDPTVILHKVIRKNDGTGDQRDICCANCGEEI